MAEQRSLDQAESMLNRHMLKRHMRCSLWPGRRAFAGTAGPPCRERRPCKTRQSWQPRSRYAAQPVIVHEPGARLCVLDGTLRYCCTAVQALLAQHGRGAGCSPRLLASLHRLASCPIVSPSDGLHLLICNSARHDSSVQTHGVAKRLQLSTMCMACTLSAPLPHAMHHAESVHPAIFKAFAEH